MAIAKKWSHYTKDNVKTEPDTFGVYEIGNTNTGEVLYIGEGHLKTRLLAHFPDATEPVVGANGYRYVLTNTKKQCKDKQDLFLKAYKEKYNRLPKYNQQSKF